MFCIDYVIMSSSDDDHCFQAPLWTFRILVFIRMPNATPINSYIAPSQGLL